MIVPIPAELSHTGEYYYKLVGIERCIASIVRALNRGGITTIASCCGHDNRPGSIVLGDKRELIIAPDYETARRIDEMFPDIHGDRQ